MWVQTKEVYSPIWVNNNMELKYNEGPERRLAATPSTMMKKTDCHNEGLKLSAVTIYSEKTNLFQWNAKNSNLIDFESIFQIIVLISYLRENDAFKQSDILTTTYVTFLWNTEVTPNLFSDTLLYNLRTLI